MSLKPTKKTDLNKGWLKSRDARDISVSINPEYHLIFSDGTNTEPKYFEAIKKEIDSKFKDRIDLDIEGTGKNTVSLFYKAKTKADRSGNVFKHVWIVYDTDDFTHEHINQTAELCTKYSSDETTYHAIWSNQCIELWFLLHFGYFQSDIHRKEYWPKLTEQLKKRGFGEYKKNRDDMYDILKPFINTAIVNAKKLADINKGKTPADSAPGTEVYQIIEKLKPYLNL
jgi:hypothetical protein